jgi:ATP-dependent Clp protease protease subunit
MATTPAAVIPPEVYGVFCGTINEDSVKRLFNSFAFATKNKIQHVHLMVQSSGGMVADGVCLYNFLRALPIEVTLYNCGTISSIAVIAYLGAKKRKTSARASFMIHRTTGSPQSATAGRLHSVAESVVMDDQRTESILREHVKLSPEEWADLDKHDLCFSAEEAVKLGFATEMGEFSPPLGSQVFSI